MLGIDKKEKKCMTVLLKQISNFLRAAVILHFPIFSVKAGMLQYENMG